MEVKWPLTSCTPGLQAVDRTGGEVQVGRQEGTVPRQTTQSTQLGALHAGSSIVVTPTVAAAENKIYSFRKYLWMPGNSVPQ